MSGCPSFTVTGIPVKSGSEYLSITIISGYIRIPHPMPFDFHATPNPMKVALPLEELQIPFELIGVDIFKGEQHSREVEGVLPNASTTASLDSFASFSIRRLEY
jgi:hypothetical protein